MFSRSATRRITGLITSIVACYTLLACQSFGVPPSGQQAAEAAASAPLAFARPEFQQIWQRTDNPVATGQVSRSWTWGPAPGASLTEPFVQGASTSRPVQYFDKARMELNGAVTDPSSPWRVTTGLLVSEMVQGRIQTGETQFTNVAPATVTIAGDSGVATNPRYADFTTLASQKSTDRTGSSVVETLSTGGAVAGGPARGVKYAAFAAQTAHNIPNVFLEYLNSTGKIQDASGALVTDRLFDWVYVMGYPITEAYWTRLQIAGKPYEALIQLYQRRALTYVPDFPDGWKVQMANVGQHYYDWRYKGTSTAAAGSPAPAPSPTIQAGFPGTGGFVGIAGSSFTYEGQQVKLKGTNYWISTWPFVGTWSNWDGPQVLAELKNAHDLGINAIRVGLPYDHFDTLDIVWGGKTMTRINGVIINQMTQLLQIASVYGMKVIFVLYDWYDNYPSPGSKDDRTNVAYLQGIVGAFANDDRVLAWDLHNEPDNYPEWQGGNQSTVIKWLQRRYGDVRDLDKRHPITVGVGNYQSLWQPASDGTTILSFVDFVAFHCYDAGALQNQIAAIEGRTGKPILLEEMGWPTAPGEKPPTGVVFNEAQQNYLYSTMLQVSRQADIAGLMQWTLYDFPDKVTTGGKTTSYEEHFGLLRLDGSWKPAASIFRDGYTGRELPSETKTYVKLTPR